MAPSAMNIPPSSALQELIKDKKTTHPAHLHHLATTIKHNLQYQHDWTSLAIHTHSTLTNLPLPRPIVSGLPPRRAYIHPDEQAEILKAEHRTGAAIEQHPEQEWVLPTHVEEKWSLSQFSAVFDSLETVPASSDDALTEAPESTVGVPWQGKNRQKRILLATIHDDSTVVYYIMHDGIVKPRQN